MGGAVKTVLTGLACGVALSLLTAVAFDRVLVELHFAISARDPLTHLAVGLTLAAIVVAAVAIPARRAARVDPAVALRQE
jgi:ABC-type antimicrobial peptide transport system permease subunit